MTPIQTSQSELHLAGTLRFFFQFPSIVGRRRWGAFGLSSPGSFLDYVLHSSMLYNHTYFSGLSEPGEGGHSSSPLFLKGHINPMSTRGGRLCSPYYYLLPRISDLPTALLLWMCPGAYDYSADEYLQSLQSWFQSLVKFTSSSKILNEYK